MQQLQLLQPLSGQSLHLKQIPMDVNVLLMMILVQDRHPSEAVGTSQLLVML